MNDKTSEILSEFAKLIQEGKKEKELAEERKRKDFIEKYKIETQVSPANFLAELSKLKKEFENVVQSSEMIEEPIVEEIKTEEVIITEISELVAEETLQETETPKEKIDPLIAKTVDSITKVAENTSLFTVPEVEKVPPKFKEIQNKLNYLEKWIYKISAEGPGSGSYWLNDLGDTDHESVKNASNNQVLTFDSTIGKWVASNIAPSEIVNNTTEVTSNTYIVNDGDYYIGVNFPAPVTITIPNTLNQGRIVIVKDESGNCYNNPITLSGNIDNDANGAIIQINNGAVQLLFRNGFWRII
jgi:hypothetical protein